MDRARLELVLCPRRTALQDERQLLPWQHGPRELRERAGVILVARRDRLDAGEDRLRARVQLELFLRVDELARNEEPQLALDDRAADGEVRVDRARDAVIVVVAEGEFGCAPK